MEEKIIDMFNNLDIKETDKLLESNINMNIDSTTMKRIKESVYTKTGIKASKNIMRKGLTIAAAVLLLVMLSMATMGVDNVVAAFGKLFSFIPGYGIVENNETIEYVVDGKNLRAENDIAIIKINNIVATKDDISISFILERKNFDESKIMKQKQKEMEELKKGSKLNNYNVFLSVNGSEYKTNWYSVGHGGNTEQYSLNFQIPSEDINAQTVYRIKHKDYDLALDFKLKPYDSFDSLEEIGPTSTQNNISITAVANRDNNKLEVELYPLNKSDYTISSFTKNGDNGYEGKDLDLQTSGGIRKYTTPGSHMGVNNKFSFDISPDDKNLVLKIPYLLVKSDESKNISLRIPKNGEKLVVNKKVEFNDCTMIIASVEKVNTNGSAYGDLRMNFRYENKSKDKVMRSVQLGRINLLGMPQSGGYSSDPDQNDIIKSIDFFLDKGEDEVLRLKFENPEYYLFGEYSLEIR